MGVGGNDGCIVSRGWWNLWLWLVGTVRCKEVYRFPHNNYYYLSLLTPLMPIFVAPIISLHFVHFVNVFCYI